MKNISQKNLSGPFDNYSRIMCKSAMSLVEMLVAMAIIMIVFAAVIPHIRAIQNSWASKKYNSEVIENGRAIVDHIRQNLIQASSITAVSNPQTTNGFIQFRDYNDIELRYDINSSNKYVQFGPPGSLHDLGGPVSSLQFICYDAYDLKKSTTVPGEIRTVSILATITNPAGLSPDRQFVTQAYLRTGSPVDTLEGPIPNIPIQESIAFHGYNAVLDSYHSQSDPYDPVRAGSEVIISVNSKSSSRILVYSGATVNGDAYVGPGGDPDTGIRTFAGGQITGLKGALEGEIDIPVISPPDRPPFNQQDEGHLIVSGSSTYTIDSDRHFNQVEVKNSSKLVIDGNNVVVVKGKFELDHDAELIILPDSSLTLYLGNKATIIEGKLNASTKKPSKLHMIVVGIQMRWTMSNKAEVHAVLQNPTGSVFIEDARPFFGVICAKQLDSTGPIHVDMDSAFSGSTGYVIPPILP
ncbi:MAG: type II secretion system protein [Planctomycetota bacterium]